MHRPARQDARRTDDARRARGRNAREIVAMKIGHHDELGFFFFGGIEYRPFALVRCGVWPPRPRAFHRTRARDSMVHVERELGARRKQRRFTFEIEERTEGRRCAVEHVEKRNEFISFELEMNPSREVHLIDVARANVLERPLDSPKMRGIVVDEVRVEDSRGAGRRDFTREEIAQAVDGARSIAFDRENARSAIATHRGVETEPPRRAVVADRSDPFWSGALPADATFCESRWRGCATARKQGIRLVDWGDREKREATVVTKSVGVGDERREGSGRAEPKGDLTG